MNLWKKFTELTITSKLRMGKGSVIEVINSDNSTSTLSLAEQTVLDGVTAGTVTASKAVVVDANKDIGDFRNVDVVNLDAGASGTAGSVDVFPATASKGKLTISCTNQTGDTTVTLNANAMGQATTVNIADPGAAGAYVVMTTAALSLAEADVLQDVVAGTVAASKAVVVDANKDISSFRNITSTGTATLNAVSGGDASLGIDGQAAAQGGAIAITGGTSSTSANAGGAVSLVGGVGGATGAGGAASVTGGAGTTTGGGGNASLTAGAGGNDAVGGAASIIGGAAGGGNRAGGAVNVTGGAGAGSAAGGAIVAASGAGGATGAGGAITVTSGAGGATSGESGALTVATGTTTAGSGSATGAVIVQSGAGATSAVAVAGGASGAVTVRSQAGGANTGGATGQAGGAGGAVAITGGAGGATNSAGAHAGGAGSDIAITAGAGGNATAGTGNGGAGGTITLTAGTGGTTTGGTAGADGNILLRGTLGIKQGAATAKTVSATLTAAEILAGIITVNQGGGAASAQQLPLASAMDTALPDFAANDAFDFSVINISVVAAEDASVTTNTGWTLVGSMDIPSYDAAGNNSSARYRAQKTGAATWTLFRIA